MASTTFKGGEKLKARLDELAKKLKRGASVQVGFLEGATYSDGTPVPMVAAIQEFGAPSRGIPPRPYFRGMIADESPHWGEDVASALKHTDYDATRALDLIGEEIAGELRQSIVNFSDPPNAPSTIAQKGFDDPLVDTGHMLNSVDYEVDEKS